MNSEMKKARHKKFEKAIRDIEKAKRSLLDVFDSNGFLYVHERRAFNNINNALSDLKDTDPKDYIIAL